MKKFICIFLAIVTFCIFPLNTLAANNQITESNMIDDLFAQLDSLALEKNIVLSQYNIDNSTYKQISEYKKLGKNSEISTIKYSQTLLNKISDIETRKTQIEEELEALGAIKITTENLYYLEELGWGNCDTTRSNPPTLSEYSQLFTIYLYDGYYSYNGKSYQYRYIRVVDDDTKPYEGLTTYDTFYMDTFPEHYTVTDFLEYTIEYFVIGYLVGEYDTINFANYTIGAIADVLSNYEVSRLSFSSNHPPYIVSVSSVTSMYYYYIYDSNAAPTWKLTGSSATIPISEAHQTALKVDDRIVYDTYTNYFTLDTGWSWYEYLEYYIDRMNLLFYTPISHGLESLLYVGDYGYFTHTPVFAPRPIDLLP